ncbi:cytochrome ubiquinol oxidase subunit I [Biformimicrobium ophioploci]|uniref:Cytochrome ubiquinol oxidase subunit I n=1 Tax=Biformimicrobium ophioploci TaxID=3036711 RepID=A0ABQ6LYI6_9GAMM|nr:cytochrome ubiquinol oxidase subunit I [Microbulbifer sp. NKW57]GMG87141.1 cytochrome ubiquinol oxidase subunit I [Microbulbifer sp. NKW57]
MLDTLLLSRIQFAANISFHILFPAITIALGWFLFYFKLRFDLSGNPVWMRAYRFWVKVFALTFALGVVSGITMSFQFGTNWPGYMEKVGNIAGPLLGYEVLTAFFLEATFLGIMLFGINRVPQKVHTLSTLLVAIGTSLSTFWIIALNSWMQTPAGHELRDGIAFPVSWMEIIFNPSFTYRLIHVLLASGLTAAFFIAGISAYRMLHGDSKRAPRLALKTAMLVAAVLAPLQVLVGDLHGLDTVKYQPAKIAAIEGVWETQKGVPLLLFAIPDSENRTNHFEIGIPRLASLILTHDPDGEVKGLNEFKGEHAPVGPVFWSFRVMVACGLLMIAVAWIASYRTWRKQPLSTGFLRVLVACTFIGWVATLSGWYVAEIGRQPWLVHGLLTRDEAVTDLAPGNVALSLSLYLLVYVVLLLAYIQTLRVMAKKSVEVEEFETEPPTLEGSLPNVDKTARGSST